MENGNNSIEARTSEIIGSEIAVYVIAAGEHIQNYQVQCIRYRNERHNFQTTNDHLPSLTDWQRNANPPSMQHCTLADWHLTRILCAPALLSPLSLLSLQQTPSTLTDSEINDCHHNLIYLIKTLDALYFSRFPRTPIGLNSGQDFFLKPVCPAFEVKHL